MSKAFKGCERLSTVKRVGFVETHTPDNLATGVIADIFQPDPVTGLPQSDIHLVLQGSLNPELSEFVRRNLLSPRESLSCPDADAALELTRGKTESVGDYQRRVQNYIKSLNGVKDE